MHVRRNNMTRIWTSFATCTISLGLRKRTNPRPTAAAGRWFRRCASRWSDEYISREIVGLLSVTQPGAAIANVASGRTPPVHYIPATKAMHFGEIVQKLLAHDDAAGTYELSYVPARSQEWNRRSGHASSVDIIHWRVLLDLLLTIGLLLCRVLCYLKGSKVSRLCLNEFFFIVLYLALLKFQQQE